MMKNLTVQLKIIVRPEKDKSVDGTRYFIGHLKKKKYIILLPIFITITIREYKLKKKIQTFFVLVHTLVK